MAEIRVPTIAKAGPEAAYVRSALVPWSVSGLASWAFGPFVAHNVHIWKNSASILA